VRSERTIRIVVADDRQVVRQSVAHLLAVEDDMEVVGEAADGAEAVALAEALRPDVMIIDVSMPGMDGIKAGFSLRLEDAPSAEISFGARGNVLPVSVPSGVTLIRRLP
jgi:DNA-binding NarL/FixJ family response regulator